MGVIKGMKLGICVAMEEEFVAISSILSNKKSLSNQLNINEYQYKNLDIVAIVSKIGKAYSSSATSILINQYKCDAILNVGSCGGVRDANVGDIIIATESGYWDVDVRGFGYKLGQIPGTSEYFKSSLNIDEICSKITSHKVLQGFVASGDSFVNDANKVEQIKVMYNNILAIDMEGASIAQICSLYNIPYILVKKVSDKADKNATDSFREQITNMEQKTSDIVLNILDYLDSKK